MGRKMFVAAANVTFEGVGIQGFTLQGELLGTALINAGAPDITIVVDGCVIQAARQFIDFNSGI